MDYVIEFEGKQFTPDGLLPKNLDRTGPESTEEHNKETERKEIAWLNTHPEKVFLYVKMPVKDERQVGSRLVDGSVSWANGDKDRGLAIQTWLGTSIATHVWVGPRRNMGFGHHSYRRAVSCQIFGVQYHGWFMESSGDYCKLRKAKHS